jgi:hypothetical protein
VIKKRALVEVFSVRMILETSFELRSIAGLILLKGCGKNYVLYEDPYDGDPYDEDPCDERDPRFDSDVYLTLVGPECGVEVKDTIVIYPWLFEKCRFFCGTSKGSTLWKSDAYAPRMDQFIRRGVRSNIGLMEVDFAVYSDGVEACLEIILSDFKFEGLLPSGKPPEVYGTIKASNSTLVNSEAKSVLFKHIAHQDCIKLSPWPPSKAEISLPLTRNVTVIPRESALVVDVSLSLSCAPQNAPIVGSAVFDATSRLSSVEERIILGQHAKAKVKVTWSA